MMKKNSLHIKIWQYFLIFSLLILGFLWVFQVLFLNQFYRISKTKDIAEVASTLVRYQNDENIADSSLGQTYHPYVLGKQDPRQGKESPFFPKVEYLV